MSVKFKHKNVEERAMKFVNAVTINIDFNLGPPPQDAHVHTSLYIIITKTQYECMPCHCLISLSNVLIIYKTSRVMYCSHKQCLQQLDGDGKIGSVNVQRRVESVEWRAEILNFVG